MSRSSKKGPFVDVNLLRKVAKQKETSSALPIKTWARACTIVPEFVGHTFEVHNGNRFIKVIVRDEMVGHKLGEFSLTRTFWGHAAKKKDKKPAR